ncbi:MAG: hypothetical protein OEY49_16940 [Candidatus Heimdallarchaeota archaeon]|nr:hypothetical protein [Candidatus Heimdallarchaeota archaeon]
MNPILTIIPSKNETFTSLLLQPDNHLLFIGTSKGGIEVWDLLAKKKLVEMRYLKVNQFGENISVDDPVVSIAAPENFEFVYAFMGNAAYCIDVKLLTIVQQIPIAEKVISGGISRKKGMIGVITEPGYLSWWSPKFYVRKGSVQFNYKFTKTHLCFDTTEKIIILISEIDDLTLINTKGEKYFTKEHLSSSSDLVIHSNYDANPFYYCNLNSKGEITVHNHEYVNNLVPDFIIDGKWVAEEKIKNYIGNLHITEEQKTYITDFRLDRENKDRYYAELDRLSSDDHKVTTLDDDSLSLKFAITEYRSEDISRRAQAISVINNIAKRRNFEPRYLFIASKYPIVNSNLIESSQKYKSKAMKRQLIIKKYYLYSVILSLILLFFVQKYNFNYWGMLLYIIPLVTQLIILYLWINTNKQPKIPHIQEYIPSFVFLSIVWLYNLMMFISNSVFE